MKKFRYSIVSKLLLHLALFGAGLVLLFFCSSFIQYTSQYGFNTDFIKTTSFEERYGKYLERVASYVQYRELGFENKKDYSNNKLPMETHQFLDNQDDDQKYFEFYDQKLNYDKTNFLYYVENTATGAKYFSPGLMDYVGETLNQKTSTVEEALKAFKKSIKTNPAYFVLNTEDMVYSTSVNHTGHLSQYDALWIARCITGEIPARNGMAVSPEKSPDSSSETASISIILESNYALLEKNTVSFSDYVIYTGIIPGLPMDGDDFSLIYEKFLKLRNQFQLSLSIIPICFLASIFLLVLLVCLTGRSRTDGSLKLLVTDRIYTELFLFFFLVLFYFLFHSRYFIRHLVHDGLSFFSFLKGLLSPVMSIILLYYIIVYPLIACFLSSLVRRVKGKTLLTGSLVYAIAHWTKKGFVSFSGNKEVTYTAALYFIPFAAAQTAGFLLLYKRFVFPAVFLLALSYAYGIYFLFRTAAQLNIVVKETKEISLGDLSHKLDVHSLKGPMKNLGESINQIGDGLSSAVEERLKSERLKTELITNVSHDIKTPLTSIINYVDLLKKEDKGANPRASDYLKVLEAKSWRLKTLIEDLVEASKASSGAITLHMEKINLAELVRQTAGEYEERFTQNHLEMVFSMPNDPVYVLADGRSAFRIVENLFSNASKYALSGTRVYIDLVLDSPKDGSGTAPPMAHLSIKNISSHKLNIPSEELMERFVRGDLARSSEGSGLGLSIARSLAELQNARFHVILDGDLFKTVLSFQVLP